ncbi:hypothetical protein PCASD_17996 [Puccinia coronata f. sp. avenae]|uniref:VLRF1 domain-containing protein n=1 Tax=Puccinia coronata f. sp. avenae TaxID=200324 RepID=A0A2N5U6I8_9BASI|nr:hypothetical protein PCASD_17996 [Puccinia coronata f. sp. avenae]
MNQQQALHPFCLPTEIIQSIRFNSLSTHFQTQQEQEHDQDHAPEEGEEEEQSVQHKKLFRCTACSITFDSRELQREHYKSDWHRFNLKLSATSSKPIDLAQFTNMLDQLNDSLSGSDSSESDADSDTHSVDSFTQHIGSSASRHAGNSTKQTTDTLLHDKFQQLLLAKNKPSPEDALADVIAQPLVPSSPLVWFSISADSENGDDTTPITQLGFYRAIFTHTFPRHHALTHQQEELGKEYHTELGALQRPFLPNDFTPTVWSSPLDFDLSSPDQTSPPPPTWTLIMMGGGHFAAMIVSVVPKLRHMGKNKPPEMEPVILHHKTFHRYTTRRKQGGGQASHDAGGKGAAKSAGASLRRYNELSLSQDIQTWLKTWAEPIHHSELVFIRASKSNLATFISSKSGSKDEAEGYKLTRGDPRVRSLPFVTKRPTFNELKRCFNELTRVKIVKTTQREIDEKEQEMREGYLREKARLELQQARKEEVEEKQRMEEERKKKERELQRRAKTAEEKELELEDSRWERVVDMVEKGKLPALQEFVKKYDHTAWFGRIPERLMEGRPDLTSGCVSLLQLAAMADQAAVVEWMLADTNSDPTMVGEKGPASTKGQSTAYELAPSRGTRNAFRRAMARHPDRFEWISQAKVPSPLTEEIETNQQLKSKERNRKLKEKLKERDRLRASNAEKNLAANGGTQDSAANDIQRDRSRTSRGPTDPHVNRLDGGAVGRPSILSHTAASAAGLSDEQRVRLERERRARAAEARLK